MTGGTSPEVPGGVVSRTWAACSREKQYQSTSLARPGSPPIRPTTSARGLALKLPTFWARSRVSFGSASSRGWRNPGQVVAEGRSRPSRGSTHSPGGRWALGALFRRRVRRRDMVGTLSGGQHTISGLKEENRVWQGDRVEAGFPRWHESSSVFREGGVPDFAPAMVRIPTTIGRECNGVKRGHQ